MSVRWMGLLMLAVLLCAMPVSAQEDSPVFNLSFTFLATPEVSIKLKAPNLGRPVRGKLVALSDGEVIVDTGVLSRRDRERGERGQRVPFSRIESLRSSDGRFEFTPDEGFKVIAQRVVDTYPSIRAEGNVEALEMDRPPRVRSKKKKDDEDEPDTMSLQDATGSEDEEGGTPSASGNKTAPKKTMGIGNKGIGGLKGLPKANKSAPEQKEEEEESTTTAEESPSENEEAGLADGEEEHYCSNCKKVLSRSALKKEECPHCGTTFVRTNASPSGQGAFAASGKPSSAEGGAFAPMGTAPAGQGEAAVAPAASNTVVVQGGSGFSFDQVPTWAKGGIFVLVILVGYHVLFNR